MGRLFMSIDITNCNIIIKENFADLKITQEY